MPFLPPWPTSRTDVKFRLPKLKLSRARKHLKRFPDCFATLGQVEEWRARCSDQLTRVRHEIENLGLCGVYFSTESFFCVDFKKGLNDKSLPPFWDLLGELEVPIFWYSTNMKQPRMAAYLYQAVELAKWREPIRISLRS